MALADMLSQRSLPSVLLQIVLAFVAAQVVYWLYRGVQVRLMYRKLAKQGIVSLPTNFHPSQ